LRIFKEPALQNETTAYIGLGSNLGDGLKTLQDAWKEIGQTEHITAVTLSDPYLSAPVDMESSNWFTNAVGMLHTNLEPEDVLTHLMAIESRFGRRRNTNIKGYQDRSLDLDIIYFGEVVMQSGKLVLPHPCLAERLFVLEPLTEIAPQFCDPVDGLTPVEKKAHLHQQMAEALLPLQKISRAEWS
jgi:2-amino-4-hydroxy-6-hydroxymethyldihydropteridine diphosphokinase